MLNFNTMWRSRLALLLVLLLVTAPARAGIVFTGTDGVVITNTDGIVLVGANGIVATGADGIVATGADGIVATGADGIVATGADGVGTYRGVNGIVMTGADGIVATGADGIVATGADGIVATGADGTRYNVDSIVLYQPTGVSASGVDSARIVGANGVSRPSADGIVATGADGIVATGADGIVATGADGIVATGADGRTFNLPPDGIVITGADNLVIMMPTGIVATGADGIVATGADGIVATGADARVGLRGLDPELAVLLDRMTDDSTINVVLVYYRTPTDADLADVQRLGIVGGTRFHVLPMLVVTATRAQLVAASHLPNLRSIYYGNRTLQTNADAGRGLTGVERVRRDAELTRANAGLPFSGRGVAVAVLDTGLDGTHADLAGRVAQNVKLADQQSAPVGFNYPVDVENVPNTDQVYGHGTFVAGIIGGSGVRSGGDYAGVAPGAKLVGLSAGDLNLFYVLDGFDYLLQHGAELGVRVVNCSFSANTLFDFNDPVNVATKLLTERNINVVFSAGNNGAGLHTLNPYAVAPWVISVGATDYRGRLASFSARGDFASSLFRPTLVAPGVGVVGLRSTGLSLTGAEGVGFNGDAGLPAGYVPFYTTATGTSFSAPQVAGTIALMLEANPNLTTAQVRDLLQRSATPLPPYYDHEVGAGMLNAHAAVLEAAFSQRRMGQFRATLDRGQVRFVNDPVQQFAGVVQPGTTGYQAAVDVPQNALNAAFQIGWGPFTSVNDLALSVYDANGAKRAEVNTLNLPGITGKRERATLNAPTAGAYQVRVRNSLGALAPTAQNVTGTLEIARAEYALMKDFGTMSATQQQDVYAALRSYVMQPFGGHFRPQFAVTRGALAEALVLGGRVPQYLPAQPTYRDVRGQSTLLFVESVQRAPQGALFLDPTPGGDFSPHAPVDRLTAAIALVRAAGLQTEADANQNTPMPSALDASGIPSQLRGYVYVALTRGLLTTDNNNFRPQATLTRADLAHALVTLQRLATQ